MRSTFFFAALLVAVAVGGAARRRATATSLPPRPPQGTVTLVGDSLNVGVERYLSDALPGWKIVANDRVGRSTPEGIAELEAGRPGLSSHVVVSLGTNDPPGSRRGVPRRCRARARARRPEPLRRLGDDLARRSAERRLQRRACATRPTRTAASGSSNGRRWFEAHPDWLAADGLHGNETGYRERARAIAEAAKGCAPAQTVTER